MRLDRLRHGELAALVLGALLLVVMFMDWYETDLLVAFGRVGAAQVHLHQTGWAATGWFAAGITGLLLLTGGVWLFMTVTQPSPAVPLITNILTVLFGIFASVSLLSRLVLQPGLGVGLGNGAVDLRWPAYAGPLLAVALTAAAGRALADERTDAAYSQPGEIELRPIPE